MSKVDKKYVRVVESLIAAGENRTAGEFIHRCPPIDHNRLILQIGYVPTGMQFRVTFDGNPLPHQFEAHWDLDIPTIYAASKAYHSTKYPNIDFEDLLPRGAGFVSPGKPGTYVELQFVTLLKA